ncbi:MAG: hypothetical protein MI757_10860 [Pirellulales bacterium]|nr:hypothetical protein [Pirellulales bacterium]
MSCKILGPLCMATICTAALCDPCAAQTKPKVTGSKFRQQLSLPVGLSWKDVPLRSALSALADDQGVSIYLDRRVDPDRKIALAINGEPLADALRSVARSQKLGVCLVGELIYFGTPDDVDRLRSVLALRKRDVGRLPLAARKPYSSVATMSWRELTTPKELLDGLSASGVRIYGDKNIPHDLWPAASLPRLAWIDRLGLLAAQFDLTVKFSPTGNAVALIPIPTDLAIDRTAGKLPKVSPAAKPGSKQVYTLKIENQPVGKLLQALGRQLGVSLILDTEAIGRAGKSLDTLVSFEVRGVELDELLRAATKPAGLSFRKHGNEVRIVPGP